MELESQPCTFFVYYECKNIMLGFRESQTQFLKDMDNRKSQYKPSFLYIAENKSQYHLKFLSQIK